MPTLANIQFIKDYGPGFDLLNFIALANSNPASRSLSFDLFILATAVFVWMFVESRRLGIRHFWVVVVGTFTIAIAFSAPLFLFLRERRIIQLKNEEIN
ncbi:hypothetical protein EV11_1241 [Prochlorococcus sp. SS52]|uniref:Uncharacterized membrane protein n=2 Tax=Prochlorococcaceae TaxID=2881426 RepID=Q7VBD9_PROMA|nr:Uncharacterized membrane protein [Prochlorococcus marinus subsp. marinus str. CCMP1375]KGG14001.1 hypothetical protein EV04_0486 [Prochlorococcus marinus str. LG]KGG19133.1 hypothetical protein EV08_1620 [Prochlorococcus marinus str. SS2]KGG23326.1 hypothetical protein EV09_0950 [Prochlorococcus marinus str. SS35]KGG32438.1 hypothetical protein EV10_1553 [Prochlorococcus marinus str. SS51]KGG35677.1 hypothetical protein EV11_1241 [Prochlorococcus sp. SS52]